MTQKTYKPGEKVPKSSQVEIVGPRGRPYGQGTYCYKRRAIPTNTRTRSEIYNCRPNKTLKSFYRKDRPCILYP